MSNHSTEMVVLPLLRCFLEGLPYIFCFMFQQPSWILFTAHCFWGKPSNGLASCSFFLRPKHWRSLEKPWHLLPWAHLANGRRAAATPRWRYVVGSHRRDFRSQVVLGCLVFLKADFYVRITILKVYVFISSLSVIIHCIHVKCLSQII